jgi:hypothetical protein
MVTFWRKTGAKPLLFKTPHGTAGRLQPFKVGTWRRKAGIAAFVADLMALRVPLLLCYHCANYVMPKRWKSVYDYEELMQFHAEGDCDYCRREISVGVFQPIDGAYWQEQDKARRIVADIKRRERLQYEKDRKYLVHR